ALIDAISAIRIPQSAIAIAGHWRVRVVVGGARHHRRPALHQTQLAGQLADYRNGIRRRWVVRLPDQAARNRGLIPAGAFFLRIVSTAPTSSALPAHSVVSTLPNASCYPASLRIARIGGLPALPRRDLAGDSLDHAERLGRDGEALCAFLSLPQNRERGLDYRDLCV